MAKYYYAPGWGGGHAPLWSGQVERAAKHYQAIVFQACEAANNWMLAKYDFVNAAGAPAHGGRRHGAALLPAADHGGPKAANELYAELSAKSPDFRKPTSPWSPSGRGAAWWQLNEYAYDSFMVRTRRA